MRSIMTVALVALFPLSAAMAQTTGTPAAPAAPAPVTTKSGLVIQTLKEGSGTAPKATDTVKVHYRGTFIDGKEFDSSY